MLWLKTSGRRLEHDPKGLLAEAEEVGHEHLDAAGRARSADRADRRREVGGAAVGQVVAVDRRHDDVVEAHALDGPGDPERLERLGCGLGPART